MSELLRCLKCARKTDSHGSTLNLLLIGLCFVTIFVQILAPLPIGFAVFLVHLATIPITGTGINPARSLGAAIIYNKDHSWDDHVSFLNKLYINRIPNSVSINFSRTISFFFFVVAFPVGVLGWTFHWSCTCCSLPPDCHQSHSL